MQKSEKILEGEDDERKKVVRGKAEGKSGGSAKAFREKQMTRSCPDSPAIFSFPFPLPNFSQTSEPGC